jgi:hypothetical protein
MQNVHIGPLIDEVDKTPDLWNYLTIRQDYKDSAHVDTKSIIFRGPKGRDYESIFNDPLTIDYGMGSDRLQDIARETGRLAFAGNWRYKAMGRLMLVKLKPGGAIMRHVDEGKYADSYTRYHLALQSDEGNEFECDGDTVHMLPGELWWFNHKKPHSAVNNSKNDRIHLIVDVA